MPWASGRTLPEGYEFSTRVFELPHEDHSACCFVLDEEHEGVLRVEINIAPKFVSHLHPCKIKFRN